MQIFCEGQKATQLSIMESKQMWTIQRPFNMRGIRGVSRQPEIQEEFFL